ncbi:MAG: hypothetical protein NZM25_03155, partial [Leptospiraceae bacterium]|nr:hypothetical protein [Leptospiraceae bacterium]
MMAFQKFRMGIRTKLLTIALVFVLPITVLFYFMLTTVGERITFNSKELMGNAYLRPLVDFFEVIVNLRFGGVAEWSAHKERGEQALAQLEQVQSRYGQELQFTPEGLAPRKRGHLTIPNLREKWNNFRQNPTSAGSSGVILTMLRQMITHAGDTSNLILDPDLDTYYLMDVTLLALPQLFQ